MYLQRFTAKFCSLKIWIKLKIETLNNVSNAWLLLLANSVPDYGGAMRDRTADLLRAKQALSQLSYSPIIAKWWV